MTTRAVVDLVDAGLPLLDEASPPISGRSTSSHTWRWAETIAAFDGYVFVTPEYNHSTSELHAIHRRLQGAGVGGGSRYVVPPVRAPAPGVAVAHVRRTQLDSDGFSETVLFVLVERDDGWWLAAGQNAPVQPGRSADPASA